MIRVRCDKCEKLLEAPDDLAGQRIECPACGDVRVLPASAASSPPEAKVVQDRAAAAGLPPDSGPEQKVMVVRTAMFRSRLGLAVLVGACLAASLTGMVYFGGVQRQPTLFWVSVAVFGAVLGVLVVWKIAHLSTALEITNKRTIARRGLVSRATTEVLHDHVRNVQITQSVWQRLLGIGRIGLSSSADDSVEIVMDDMPSPDRIRRVIDLYRPL
jgi:phage FluMu protein Com